MAETAMMDSRAVTSLPVRAGAPGAATFPNDVAAPFSVSESTPGLPELPALPDPPPWGPSAAPWLISQRRVLRFYGSKWGLAQWIIGHFPSHDCYVEPFGGAASVLLQKEPGGLEVYNDLEGGVVNFFRVLRERPDDLIRALWLTPYARQEARRSKESTDDPLERARLLYVALWMGFGKMRNTESIDGWRLSKNGAESNRVVDEWNRLDHLYRTAWRLKYVQIECESAEKVIRRYDSPTTLYYVDPPYVAETRSKRWATAAYLHEFSEEDHRALAAQLHTVAGAVVVSGYPSALYEELYGDWRKVGKDTTVTMRLTSGGSGRKSATECLWLNERASRGASQIPLPLE